MSSRVYSSILVFYCYCIDSVNDHTYQWIAFSDWIYETKFDLADNDVNNRQLFLKCDGLDTAATVRSVLTLLLHILLTVITEVFLIIFRVNDVVIGSADSFFRRWLFNMTVSLLNQ